MQYDKNLLVVGGAGRNVGKTEFACQLINRIAAFHPVYGLKVSAIYPDESMFHGNHGARGVVRQVFEETQRDIPKDTGRMLRAGAERVFFLCCRNEEVEREYCRFREKMTAVAPIICESNSLADYVRPGLRLMIVPQDGEIKPRVVEKLQLADLVIPSAGSGGFPELERVLFFPERGWVLRA